MNKIVWTNFAANSLKDIYDYYSINVSKQRALNIKDSIFLSARQLLKFPKSGALEERLEELNYEYRYIIRGNYKVIYRIENNIIYITDVFDVRQNPDKILIRSKF